MAVYKVPQDVEADDKLIGPFSFRQFIYLIIAVLAIAVGWGLSQLFFPLAILPLPIVIFFGALALPLRKDQPMEIYLAAIVSFYLKPRKRLWQADGIQSLVEITAPKVVERQRTKNLSQTEAQQRLSYLADIVDTGGWAVRGVAGMPEADNTAMRSDVYFAAQQTTDILDESGGVARSFNAMIDQSDARRRQAIVERMHQPTPAPAATPIPAQQVFQAPTPPIPDPYAPIAPAPQTPVYTQPITTGPDPVVSFNPYPNSMRQMVIAPLGEQPAPVAQPAQAAPAQPLPPVQNVPTMPPQAPITTSENLVSADIMSLASNNDLSIETIAHEAQRIHQKESAASEEVIISLR